MQFRFALSVATILVALCWTAGCGERAPSRYPVSGSVTWGGRSVPAGYLVFTPDSSQGNSGPGAQVEIKNGRYTTTRADGPIGGPHQVTIYGFDGQAYQDGQVTVPTGRPLFAGYSTQVDIRTDGGSVDIVIPGPE